MNSVALFLAAWFFLGWVGWRILLFWWTSETPMTRKDRNGLRGMTVIFGPVTFLILVIVYGLSYTQPKDPNDIIYPKRKQNTE